MDFTPSNILLLSLVEAAVSFYFFPHIFNKKCSSIVLSCLCCGSRHSLVLPQTYHIPLLPQAASSSSTSSERLLPTDRPWMILFKRPPGEAFLNMLKQPENDGLTHFHGFLHADRLLLASPAALADVLVHRSYDFEKPPWSRNFLRKFLGDGLLMTEGDEHRHQRKQIMPAFSFRHIKELYPVFWAESIELCEVVKRELWEQPDKVLDIGHFSTMVTLDIIGLAGLGRDISSLRNNNDVLIENYKGFVSRVTPPIPTMGHGALPSKLNERVKVTTGNLKRICGEFGANKKSRMKMESEEGKDILSIMIRSNNFSDDGLVDQLLTFLAAGYMTYSRIISTLRKFTTTSPDRKALSDPDFDVATLLESLPYPNAVCNEVLRLFPSIPVSARLASRDTTVCGHFIPKGTLLHVVPWATNRDPALWGSDSEKFVPERWIDGSGRCTMNGGADSNYSFLTFLHGPRNCIGERFARAEMRALVAAFVGEFKMRMADPEEKVRPGGRITSKPIDGIRLKLEPVA
ncbi:hypothetical protein PMIN04_010848 [Paraphaeosphaeria minitans]